MKLSPVLVSCQVTRDNDEVVITCRVEQSECLPSVDESYGELRNDSLDTNPIVAC
jgi:hypothetical protein